ncbi:serine hydrolase domain-containing protein [Pleomorphomonas sp. PLEO]|uniref:serine hydrolase domain-containing protein n=1 Tax=Pleomorphomonas sp. PLEO TaxID=3239306 RepID=UPI00351EF862
MSRCIARSAIALAILAAIGTPVHAADYRPVQCAARAPYAGAPLHAAFDIAPIGPIANRALPEAVTGRLDGAYERIRTVTAASAMTAAVAMPGKGLWQRTDAPAGAPLLFWASVGKTFTAVVILQMVREGKLSLDDPVSRWVSDVPNGDVATVRDLLAHTGGLFSANEDFKVHADPRYRDPAANLAVARRHGAIFCPGENWHYSNTGYDLLGEIVRQIDHRSIDDAITARIITPLGLTSMRALAPGRGSAGVAPLVTAIEKPMDPSWAGAAGPIVSTAADMTRFWAALLGGRLLPERTVREMARTLYPMYDPGTYYGLGLMVFDVADGARSLRWIGHAGGTPGASAVVAYSPADKAIVAVALTGDGASVPAANLLLKALMPPEVLAPGHKGKAENSK